jgi:hypothetical protein
MRQSGLFSHLAATAFWAALAILPRAAAAQDHYALIVEGVSGDDQISTQHRQWVNQLASTLKQKLRFAESRVILLTETPGQGEALSNAVNVKAAFAKLTTQVKGEDELFVMLIGHGGGAGADAKFNLVGPDLTATEWNDLLKPIAGRIVFVNASSASAGYLKTLAGANRIIITATNSPAQVYHPEFGGAFIQALTSVDADIDKNDRVSLWEAFVYASRLVEEHYQQTGHLSTEHAILDDTGEGTGRDATAKPTGATLSSLTYLDTPVVTKSADPAVQALIDRRDALTKQIDDLRLKQSSIPAAEYEQAFETLALELAQVSAEIRKRGGGE